MPHEGMNHGSNHGSFNRHCPLVESVVAHEGRPTYTEALSLSSVLLGRTSFAPRGRLQEALIDHRAALDAMRSTSRESDTMWQMLAGKDAVGKRAKTAVTDGDTSPDHDERRTRLFSRYNTLYTISKHHQ